MQYHPIAPTADCRPCQPAVAATSAYHRTVYPIGNGFGGGDGSGASGGGRAAPRDGRLDGDLRVPLRLRALLLLATKRHVLTERPLLVHSGRGSGLAAA